MAETTVVRIRRQGGVVVQDCDVYIGRRMTMGGWNLPESKWANPFTIKEYKTAEEVCKRYEAYMRKRLETEPRLKEELGLLRGRRLGCWCAPKPCHGNVLVRLIREMSDIRV